MKPNLTTKETTTLSYFRWLIALMLAFSALCFYKPHGHGYSVFTRTWGFDHFSFYGKQVQIFIYAVALLLIIPYTNNFIVKFLSMLAAKMAALRKIKVLLFIVLSVLSVAVFYFARTKYFFLGDFNLRLEQVMKKQFLSTEYLTMKLLYYFSAFGVKQGFTPYQMFAYYSCIMGGVFTFFCFLIADLLGKGIFQKLFFFLAQVSTALILIFCGYIEIYATPIVFLFMYLYFGLRYLKYNTGFYFVLISLGFAICSHLLSFAAAPTVAVLWYLNNRKKFGFIAVLSNKQITIRTLILAGIALFVALASHSGLILPLTPPREHYMTLFSFKHFWEFLNGELLACGLSFIILPFLLMKVARRGIPLNDATYFLLYLTGCILYVVALLNLHRGSGDWDLMALPAISLNLLTAVLITIVYAQNSSVKNYLLVCVFGINALQTVLWVNVNRTDKSIAKIDKMLTNDPGTYYTKLPSLLQLGLLYEANKLVPQAEMAGEKACNDHTFNDVRSCMFYVKKLVANKKQEKALPIAESILSMAPTTMELYFFMLQYYQEKKQQALFIGVLNRMFVVFQQQTEPLLKAANPAQTKNYIEAFNVLFKFDMEHGASPEKLNAVQNLLARLQTKQTTGV